MKPGKIFAKIARPMLKECPWCGPTGEPAVVATRSDCHRVECSVCGSSGRSGITNSKAAEAWNARAAIMVQP